MKTEMTFTPGPWFATTAKDKTDSRLMVLSPHHPICQVVTAWKEGRPTDEANARLIAAAPALFEALQGFLELATDAKCIASVKWTTARDQARAALKLAGKEGV